MNEYMFKVVERGQYAYILWPWKTPASFLYEALEWGARYELSRPWSKATAQSWIEFIPGPGCQGENRRGLLFGLTNWGNCLYRRFNARESHYLTQHGLDGLPANLWEAAYEYEPGTPIGSTKISFRVESKKGVFALTFYDWMQYFRSGRNARISDLGITIKEQEVA